MLKMSSATRSSNNLLLSIDVVEFEEIGVGDDNCEDEMVGRSSSKNLNGATGYLTPDAKQVFT